MEDFVDNITRGNPGSVKSVPASVILALAAYQLILAAIGYRKLPLIGAKPAFFTHRASGDVIAILLVLVALACLAAFGLEDDHVLHGAAGIGAVAVLALIAPSSASAATVTTEKSCDRSLCLTSVSFEAAPGEANALTVTHDAAAVTFNDAVPFQAGKGCMVIAGGARCATPPDAPLSTLGVKLSDRDDVATLDMPAAVHGGAGNDQITGSGLLSGGPGADELIATAATGFSDDDGARPARDSRLCAPTARSSRWGTLPT